MSLWSVGGGLWSATGRWTVILYHAVDDMRLKKVLKIPSFDKRGKQSQKWEITHKIVET